MEEAAEIQQACTKALRFGLNDGYPGSETTNAQDINAEFNDLLGVVELLQEGGNHVGNVDSEAIAKKKAKVRHYMSLAEELGTLDVAF